MQNHAYRPKMYGWPPQIMLRLSKSMPMSMRRPGTQRLGTGSISKRNVTHRMMRREQIPKLPRKLQDRLSAFHQSEAPQGEARVEERVEEAAARRAAALVAMSTEERAAELATMSAKGSDAVLGALSAEMRTATLGAMSAQISMACDERLKSLSDTAEGLSDVFKKLAGSFGHKDAEIHAAFQMNGPARKALADWAEYGEGLYQFFGTLHQSSQRGGTGEVGAADAGEEGAADAVQGANVTSQGPPTAVQKAPTTVMGCLSLSKEDMGFWTKSLRDSCKDISQAIAKYAIGAQTAQASEPSSWGDVLRMVGSLALAGAAGCAIVNVVSNSVFEVPAHVEAVARGLAANGLEIVTRDPQIVLRTAQRYLAAQFPGPMSGVLQRVFAVQNQSLAVSATQLQSSIAARGVFHTTASMAGLAAVAVIMRARDSLPQSDKQKPFLQNILSQVLKATYGASTEERKPPPKIQSEDDTVQAAVYSLYLGRLAMELALKEAFEFAPDDTNKVCATLILCYKVAQIASSKAALDAELQPVVENMVRLLSVILVKDEVTAFNVTRLEDRNKQDVIPLYARDGDGSSVLAALDTIISYYVQNQDQGGKGRGRTSRRRGRSARRRQNTAIAGARGRKKAAAKKSRRKAPAPKKSRTRRRN